MSHGVTFNVTKDVFGSTLVTIDENGAQKTILIAFIRIMHPILQTR